MKLYPKSREAFQKEWFQDPPKEYRGAPFWAWNTKLNKNRLREQIEALEEMGMGGFHIHSRIGLETEYLGGEFLEDVRFCAELAKEKGMRCFLYDEDKWPSGYGAGRVTKEKQYRNVFLLFSPEKKTEGPMFQSMPKQVTRLATGGLGRLAARYEVILRKGRLERYRRLGETERAEGAVWYAYLVKAEDSPWFNGQSYVDTLNPEATRKFLRETHERYAAAVGGEFGKTIPSIFTDEPQFSQKDNFSFADSQEELKLPWTEGLEEGYRKKYGYSLLERLPELFWERPEGVSEVRYAYHDYVAERFAESYGDVIGDWCERHGLLLTGHMMEEAELGAQTRALGEAMRQYRSFGLPGIDILADRREYNTAKQAQSMARQCGREGVLSELYGATNWDFDFRGHKRQGDWQAALGVTLRVPHLSWLSMKGEAKRDYPAPLDEHSPWYRKYRRIEDYFARLNVALTRGKPEVSVAVVHPVESYWLAYGPNEQTAGEREEMEERFRLLTDWLLFGLLDFDFLCEAMLPRQACKVEGNRLRVGEMSYQAVLVPPLKTVRKSTLEILKEFADRGGTLLWLEKKPDYIQARKPEGERETEFGEVIPFSRNEIEKRLEPFRLISLKDQSGLPVRDYLSQIRAEGEERWIFLAPGREKEKCAVAEKRNCRLSLSGVWQAEIYDALDGSCRTLPVRREEGKTTAEFSLWEDDSFLCRLKKPEIPERLAGIVRKKEKEPECLGYLKEPKTYFLEEPNALLLDSGEIWAGDMEPFVGELLKAEDRLRKHFGYALRTESFPQPWLGKQKAGERHPVSMRCRIFSEMAEEQVILAAEAEKGWKFFLNGEPCRENGGHWLDPAFRLFGPLRLEKGENQLLLEIPFGKDTALEWMYLLGDFGVRAAGRKSVVTKKPERPRYGSLTEWGFPFYGGKATLVSELDLKQRGHILIQAPDFAGSLAEVWCEGRGGEVFLSPYLADLGVLEAGTHEVKVVCYGNRVNQFGQLHNRDSRERYYGPKTWRTEGAGWSEEYQLHPAGILSAPVIWRKEN